MAGEAASGRAGLMEPEPAPALALVPVTARKPRGRPLGSKNKPKPPVVVTRESEAAMRPVVLELAAGCDVVSEVAAFARRRRVGVSVLCGRGAVAAVTLRLAAGTAAASASAVTLHGRFEVLALSGTVLPSWCDPGAGHGPAPAFSVSLAGVGGQVIGGTLAGEMTAADGVVVVAAVFRTAEVHRLPAAGAEDGDGDGDGGGGREEWRHPHSQQQLQVAGDVAGLGGYGGGGGHVGQHAEQLAEIGLWGQQPTPSHGPVHPLHRF
ncbi:unnamed protein product [Miscanthus lutarioriparius]|uniref:AT-hook motif nuclear-localized protein n=1 Tax=Miscanthus lutarioriparius TaxID=422564 RepID=A0A811P2T9_9POAL|nr:unnamed protein product [Miscanthus lutarioriparius]